jgi:hypothetical protein
MWDAEKDGVRIHREPPTPEDGWELGWGESLDMSAEQNLQESRGW